MNKFFLLLLVYFSVAINAAAVDVLEEERINQIAQQFVDFHKTETQSLLQPILSENLTVTVTQGSNGYGFILNYNKSEYIEYLSEGHKSRTRVGTDVSFISSEILGNKEAKVILRYRSKKLGKYVWVEAIIRIEAGIALITEVEEYT
ncbi:hypothetical protein [Thalassotalea crassostreae]|uniref:hypothetical protein n=1 Tax=Thalassotalea crassostreae TaxID=1763536 RepID=UPI0008383E93|nr:hypothetical protein [Thalassotalea crassostreae]